MTKTEVIETIETDRAITPEQAIQVAELLGFNPSQFETITITQGMAVAKVTRHSTTWSE